MDQDPSESPVAPRRRDSSYYFTLIFLVGPVWGIVPLSWCYVFYFLRSGRLWASVWRDQLIFIAATCEAIFSVYQYILARRIAGLAAVPPNDPVELQTAFKRVLQAGLAALPDDGGDEESLLAERPGSPAEIVVKLQYNDPRAIDFRTRLRTWFGKVPWSSLRTEQVYEWLYWSIFNTHLHSLDTIPHAQRTVLDEVLNMLEKRAGAKIQKGSNPKVKPMRLTIDPANISMRPLTWYIFVRASNVALRIWYQNRHDLTFGCFNGLEYLIRTPQGYSSGVGPSPVVFIHGLGLGLFQYQRFLHDLLKGHPDAPLLILLQPQISQDIIHPRYLKPMRRFETVKCLHGLLESLGWIGDTLKDNKGVTILSHSNGSYAHAWFLKSYPALVIRSCFVDPVIFCSWEGDVCYNFFYRTCTTGVELLMRYYVGTELGVTNVLQRHFEWASNALWFEEIPHARDPVRCRFFLAGKDAIVDSERARKYLTSHGVKKGIWLDPEGRHGQALVGGGTGLNEIMRWLRQDPEKY
ncbi:hypothetical protein BD410DRAFT_780011 [Rickenella mellea]|uniref:Alpha/beta-hydrolase n=1 Tax=Rickenella mellea TaxID=50990 RepID=A0A4V3AZL3_9AGAM|nr:hypothetical protein BD410DRAFT_780011 [Rickenella mellea]